MAPKSLYQILEIPTDASEREIKRAYHTLAKKLHPDKASSPDEAQRLEQQMALVSQAYNTLKDTSRRQDYDRHLKADKSHVSSDSSMAKTATATVTPPPAEPSRPRNGKAAPSPDNVRRASIGAKALAKGLQLMQAGEPRKAIEFLEAAVANNDQDALAHAKLAEALLTSGRSFTRATELAERAIELDPWNVQHRLTLAHIYESAGVSTRALQAYREVLRWDATNSLALMKLRELGGRSTGGAPFSGLFGRLFGRKR